MSLSAEYFFVSDNNPSELINDVECSRFQEMLSDRPKLLQLRSLLLIYESLPGMSMKEMVELSGLEIADLTVLVSSLSTMSSTSLLMLGFESSLIQPLRQISDMNFESQEQSDNTSSGVKHKVVEKSAAEEFSVENNTYTAVINEPFVPKFWYEAKTEDGVSYYWHVTTQESRWDKPKGGYITMEEQKVIFEVEKEAVKSRVTQSFHNEHSSDIMRPFTDVSKKDCSGGGGRSRVHEYVTENWSEEQKPMNEKFEERTYYNFNQRADCNDQALGFVLLPDDRESNKITKRMKRQQAGSNRPGAGTNTWAYQVQKPEGGEQERQGLGEDRGQQGQQQNILEWKKNESPLSAGLLCNSFTPSKDQKIKIGSNRNNLEKSKRKKQLFPIESSSKSRFREVSNNDLKARKSRVTCLANKRHRFKACTKCSGCLIPDCQECIYCLDKPKYGGRFVLKQKCVSRACKNPVMATCKSCTWQKVEELSFEKDVKKMGENMRGVEGTGKEETGQMSKKEQKAFSKGRENTELCCEESCKNPCSFKCVQARCRRCCKEKAFVESFDCEGHRVFIKSKREEAKIHNKEKNSVEEKERSKDRLSISKLGKRSYGPCKESSLSAPPQQKLRKLFVKDAIRDLENLEVVDSDLEVDVYHIIPLKEIDIDELLKVPSDAEVLKEKAFDDSDVQIKEATAKHNEEMKAVDDSMIRHKAKMKMRRKECVESRLRRIKMEEELTESQILTIFYKHSEYLKEIKHGKVECERHQAFMSGGLARWSLNLRVYDGCFSDDLIEVILNAIDKVTGLEPKERILNADYNWKVLLPEFLIKVCLLKF